MKNRLIAILLLFALILPGFMVSCDYLEDILPFGDKNDDLTDDLPKDDELTDEVSRDDDKYVDKSDEDMGVSDDYLADLAKINVPERFKQAYTIDRAKLENAANAAVTKLKSFAEKNGIGKAHKWTVTSDERVDRS